MDRTVQPDDRGIRPAGPPDECFYCEARVGEQHQANCVILQRVVMIEATVTHPIPVPESWTAEDIEFIRNDGTTCANRWLEELDEIAFHRCLCGIVKFKYLRDATDEDIEAFDMVRPTTTSKPPLRT